MYRAAPLLCLPFSPVRIDLLAADAVLYCTLLCMPDLILSDLQHARSKKDCRVLYRCCIACPRCGGVDAFRSIRGVGVRRERKRGPVWFRCTSLPSGGLLGLQALVVIPM